MPAGQKAFKKTAAPLKATPKNRQYDVAKAPAKRIVSYKLSTELPARVEAAATELRELVGRKVWPAHVVEAAVNAFLELDSTRQTNLIEKTQ